MMLHVDNITLSYGAAQALRGVSLTAEPGKVTCVLGRNGVGKTSLLRAMAGQQAISSGGILLDGQVEEVNGTFAARANARGTLLIAGGTVFARNQSGGSYALVRAPRAGGGPEVLYAELTSGAGIAVDADYVYVADRGAGQVLRVKKTFP